MVDSPWKGLRSDWAVLLIIWYCGSSVRSRELGSMIFMDSFQLELFYDYVTLWLTVMTLDFPSFLGRDKCVEAASSPLFSKFFC